MSGPECLVVETETTVIWTFFVSAFPFQHSGWEAYRLGQGNKPPGQASAGRLVDSICLVTVVYYYIMLCF